MHDDRLKQLRDALCRLDKTNSQRIGDALIQAVVQVLPGGTFFDAAIPQAIEKAEMEGVLSLVIEQVLYLHEHQASSEKIETLRLNLASIEAALLSPPLPKKLSRNAVDVMLWVARRSERGLTQDFLVSLADIIEGLGLSETEAQRAMDELGYYGFVNQFNRQSRGDAFWPNGELFWVADREVHDWDIEQNAWELASKLVEHEEMVCLRELQADLKWEARKVNPAAMYLVENGYAEGSEPSTPVTHAYGHLQRTFGTIEFFESRGQSPK